MEDISIKIKELIKENIPSAGAGKVKACQKAIVSEIEDRGLYKVVGDADLATYVKDNHEGAALVLIVDVPEVDTAEYHDAELGILKEYQKMVTLRDKNIEMRAYIEGLLGRDLEEGELPNNFIKITTKGI